MSCDVGRRCRSDPALLWLWRRLTATTPIRLLAWEPPYAMGAVLKRQKKKKKDSQLRVWGQCILGNKIYSGSGKTLSSFNSYCDKPKTSEFSDYQLCCIQTQ